ncbi:MAG TPA: nitroreductase family deazaflavin-dependent oxidoreductase [Terriglobales bacterium]|nr:nitroreductase family deazaflavin-dependent oxidoreductase [Terriglobales bacterium]
MKKTNPSSSSKTNNEKYLYLTTQGRSSGLPREIEIWFTAFDDRLYIIAEYETSNWVKNVKACPEVKVRVGGEAFAGTARIISGASEPDLNARIQSLSREKYGWGDGLVVEITPKPGD